MDEPTAALAIKEVGKVLDLINSLKKTGVGVIVISHRMDDIFAVCDRVMALFHETMPLLGHKLQRYHPFYD